jgi:hypothetical protein
MFRHSIRVFLQRLGLAALVLVLPLAAVTVAAPARAEAPSASDQSAIRSVIERQIDAFQRDDARAAFDFASPMIREKFGDAQTFLNMVRRGYAPVYRPQAVEFRQLGEVHGRLAQRVFLIGPEGRGVVAFYFMEKQPDGTWRIDGVYIAPAADKAV